MAATLSSFSFSAFGLTMDEVVSKLEALTTEIIMREGGEPWLITTDEYKKSCIDTRTVLDPKSWVYIGKREVIFAGPSPIDTKDDLFRDGFRPQSDPDL